MASHEPVEVLSLSELVASDLNGWRPLCDHCKELDILNQSEAARIQRTEQSVGISKHPRFRNFDASSKFVHLCCCCDYILEELKRTQRRLIDTSRVKSGSNEATASETNSGMNLVISLGKFGGRVNVRNARRSVASFGVAIVYLDTQSCSKPTILPHELWYVQPDPKSDEALKSISARLQSCGDHASCPGPEEQVLPDRYIDVGTKTSPSLHLSERNTIQRGRYLALSYVWGGYRECMLTSKNYSDFKTQMPEAGMPKTYRDVIHLARELAIRFIWVDALCIIQDSLEDWERQSAKMAGVYGNAYLTVCASNASAATDGFLNKRDPSYVYCGEGTYLGRRCAAYLTQSPHPFINHGYFSREPITSRAWCVQERVLSPRKLHFCSREIIWECRTHMSSEQGREFEPATKSFASFTQSDTVYRWAEILSNYTACHLTNQSDRLPALSGIASAYATVTGDTYIAGHWASQLPLSLLWHRGLSKLYRVERYRAPSWAWPSTEGKIILYMIGQQEVARVIGFESTPDGQNSFGNVQDAWLKISGPLIAVQCPAFRDATSDLTGYIFLDCAFEILLEHDSCTVDGSVALDGALDAPNVFLLIVARDVEHEQAHHTAIHRYHCIVLVPFENRLDVFLRAGMCMFSCEPELSTRFSKPKLVTLI